MVWRGIVVSELLSVEDETPQHWMRCYKPRVTVGIFHCYDCSGTDCGLTGLERQSKHSCRSSGDVEGMFKNDITRAAHRHGNSTPCATALLTWRQHGASASLRPSPVSSFTPCAALGSMVDQVAVEFARLLNDRALRSVRKILQARTLATLRAVARKSLIH
jgi:hypothetical protein